MPKPMPPYGWKYMYEKSRVVVPIGTKFNPYRKQRNQTPEQYLEAKEEEDLNLLERELMMQYEVDKHVKFDAYEENVEVIDSEEEDPEKRIKSFMNLRHKLLEMEKNAEYLHTNRRELIMRKMNKLAEKGISQHGPWEPE
eukprot:CAMPEP_0114591238 /NCGR_PEP_ID=MMETSP0125-20121206/13335_1 /TAXON_ID=485358 ORGANISM="Aristerostoma sp., Strain ATCC 50986" /NCGR_SAMPLE_ID=MMETSP0125 /ASSEMBLY_ACC=CAM_ASM_000245 /LENGTH=139 /DNA_ID=CAMNT_0001789223 /DNA_START=225 /DNA_END=644 /DNA_ORIENTATION=+